jgi:hypothetical protein
MKFAVIVWRTDADVIHGNGDVYCWVETLGCAVNTALNLMQSGTFAKAIAVKMI